MRILHLLCISMILPIVLLTGCNAHINTLKNSSTSIFQQDGCTYDGKYYYTDNSFAIKAFDENSKKSEYLCDNKNCMHNEGDATCVSFSSGVRAFIASNDYMYIFVRGYSDDETGHIDRVDLKNNSRSLYSNTGDFHNIYNAYLVDNKIFFSDKLPNGGCSIKVFDIGNKTIKFIANVDADRNIFAYITSIYNDTLCYREDYSSGNITSDPYSSTSYDSIGMPSWYNNFITSTSLFTYDLKTNKKVNTSNDIIQSKTTYYQNGLYYIDSDNNGHRIDWINGKDEIVFSTKDEAISKDDTFEISPYAFDDNLNLISYQVRKTNDEKSRKETVIKKRFFYNVVSKSLQPFDYDDEAIIFVVGENELNNGFIVGVTTKQRPQYQSAYMSKSDYYGGKMNLIELE